MTKKRRVFDIDLPEDETPPQDKTFPAGKVSNNETKRRGPMAAAISENADSLRDRAEAEAQIRAENDALAFEHVRLKRLGLMNALIPLDEIVAEKLVRDRARVTVDYELADLKVSIAEIGLSNPVRVEPREDGKYELVQGFRRLAAYRELRDENPDDEAFQTVPAAIFAPGETLEMLYRRMVDENLVRKDISYAEMAKLALLYVDDPKTETTDVDAAVKVLFKSAPYQKRSYIRTFVRLMDMLWKDLMFAEEIPRALGVALLKRIEEVPGTVRAIQDELRGWDERGVADELDVLRRYAGGVMDEDDALEKPSPQGKTPLEREATKARQSIQMLRPQGQVKCTAGAGRIEIRLDRDFSTIDRRKLEMAVQRFLDYLD